MCVNQDWNKWHRWSLRRDKWDLAENLALFIYKPINKPQSGQQARCVKPQEGCLARAWALLPLQRSSARGSFGVCWRAVGIPAAAGCHGMKGGCVLPLCTVWSPGIFQNHNSKRTSFMKNVGVRKERWSEGRELLARTALFFHTLRNPFATKAKPSSRGISHFCILAFLLAVTVSRRDGRFCRAFPCHTAAGTTFPCPRPGLCRGPASSRSQCSSHTSAH